MDHDNHHACRQNFNCTLYLPLDVRTFRHLRVQKSRACHGACVVLIALAVSADCSSFVFRSVYRLALPFETVLRTSPSSFPQSTVSLRVLP